MACTPVTGRCPSLVRVATLTSVGPTYMRRITGRCGMPGRHYFADTRRLLTRPGLTSTVFVYARSRSRIQRTLVTLRGNCRVLVRGPVSPDTRSYGGLLRTSHGCSEGVMIYRILHCAPFFSGVGRVVSRKVVNSIMAVRTVRGINC